MVVLHCVSAVCGIQSLLLEAAICANILTDTILKEISWVAEEKISYLINDLVAHMDMKSLARCIQTFWVLYKQHGWSLDSQWQASTNKVNTAKTPFNFWGAWGALCVCVLHPSPPLVFLVLPFQYSNNPFSWGPLDCFAISIQKDQRESEAQLVAFPFKAVTFRPCLCYRCLLAGLCQTRFDGEFDPCQADLCEQMQFFLVVLHVFAWQEWAVNGPDCAHGARATLSVQKEFAHWGPCPCSCSSAQAEQFSCTCAAQEAKQPSL